MNFNPLSKQCATDAVRRCRKRIHFVGGWHVSTTVHYNISDPHRTLPYSLLHSLFISSFTLTCRLERHGHNLVFPKVVPDEMLFVGADVLCGTNFGGPKMRWMCEEVNVRGCIGMHSAVPAGRLCGCLNSWLAYNFDNGNMLHLCQNFRPSIHSGHAS